MKPFYLFLFELCFKNIKFISPKPVNPSTVDQRKIGSSDGCGWLEKTEETVENKTQVVTSPETGETAANWSGDSVTFHGLSTAFWMFYGDKDVIEMTDVTRASDRYQP